MCRKLKTDYCNPNTLDGTPSPSSFMGGAQQKPSARLKPMQIIVEIAPETGARLAAQAQARGVALEFYIAEKLENLEAAPAAGLLTPPAGRAARLADLEQFFTEMAKFSDKTPALPEEAFTRASFYQNHD